MQSRGQWNWNQHWMDWLTRCDAIAASDLFLQTEHPEDQVILLKATLLRSAAEGVDWQELYRWICDQWRTRRPHFPDLNTMAAEIDHYRSRSNGMYCMHSTENFPHRPRKRLPAASPQISQKTRLEPTTNLPGKREKRMSPQEKRI